MQRNATTVVVTTVCRHHGPVLTYEAYTDPVTGLYLLGVLVVKVVKVVMVVKVYWLCP